MAADAGKHKALYDLYDDLLIDGVLSDAVDKRIEAITNAEIRFLSDSQGAEETMNTLIGSSGFENLLRCIMNSKFYGRAGGEFSFTPEGGFSFTEFPAKHISLESQTILLRDTDEKGVPYTGDPFLLVLGNSRDKGLLLKAAPMAIYKRGGFGDYSQWIELFGMPQRIGKYSSQDASTRMQLVQALEEAGSSPYVVVPKESDIETVNNGQGGNGDSYNQFRQACNEEMLITVLGQTMTTVQGEKGARSLGEVHKEVEESKNRSDRKFADRVLNEIVAPMLEKRGYPIKGGKFTFPESVAELTVADIVQLSNIMDIPVRFAREKYAIPEPDAGEEVLRAQVQTATIDDTDDDDGPGGPGKDGKKNLFDRALNFFVAAPGVAGAFNSTGLTLADEQLTEADRQLLRFAWEAKGNATFAPQLFTFFATDLVNALNRGFTSQPLAGPAFDYHRDTPVFISAMEMNIFHFSAAKDIAELQQLNQLIAGCSTYDDFEKKAARIVGKFNRSWQRTEYNTAVNTARAADLYWRLKGQTETFPYWEYVTVDDDKVRDEHAKLHGLILPANDPLWQKIFPPNDWNCRCRVRPLMRHELPNGFDLRAEQAKVADYMDEATYKKAKATGWATNRAEAKEVFHQNQMYVRKFPGQASRLLRHLFPSDWGLPTLDKGIAAANRPLVAYDGTADEWFAQHQKAGMVTLADHKARPLTLTPAVFKKHTTGKYAERVPLLGQLANTLRFPDEVWVNDSVVKGKFNQYVFVKFFSDGALVAVSSVEKGTVNEVLTWFKITDRVTKKTYPEGTPKRDIRADDPRYKYRRGLLIYTKGNP